MYIIFIFRSRRSTSSKKRKRPGILGNNEESDGEMDNLPSPAGDEDPGNVSQILPLFSRTLKSWNRGVI